MITLFPKKILKIGATVCVVIAVLAVVRFFALWQGYTLPIIAATHLPKERPSGLTIEFSDGGGMTQDGLWISITDADGSLEESDTYGTKKSFQFTLSDAELDTLWRTIYDQSFDLIQTTEERVYDRGGITIRISYDDTSVEKSDNGGSFVTGGWEDHFSAVAQAITNVAYNKKPLSY